MPPLAPSTGAGGWPGSEGLVIGYLPTRRLHLARDQRPDEVLLLGDAARGIDDLEAEFVYQPIILVQNAPLEQPEALDGIAAPAEIHPCFVEFELHAPGHQPIERDVNRHAEVEREIGTHGEAV